MMIKYLSIAAVAAAQVEKDGNVLVFKDANFSEMIEQFSDGVLVEFYAPWCGHCKALAPEYAKAADTMESEGSKYKLAKVDATVESNSARQFGVQGYPTLKWFQGKDNVSEYDGPREAAGIVSWIKAATGPVVQVHEDEESHRKMLEEDKGPVPNVTLLGPEQLEIFDAVAKKNRKIANWHYRKSDGAAVLKLVHSGEDEIESTDVSSEEAIEKWVKANQLPFVGEISGETFGMYVGQENAGLIWMLFPMKTETFKEVADENRPMMLELAKSLKAKDVNFPVTYTNTAEFGNVMESMFGVKEFPKVVIQKKAGDKKYFVYEGEITADGVSAYVDKIIAGEITPNLKSEPAPAEPQSDPVKVIVGSTLKEKVFTSDKDVLLEIYAPWCGHCKKLEPEYIKVGKKIDHEGFTDKIVIAKMDGTANDSPVDSIEWSGFPTIFYVKKGSEEVIPFTGERTAKAIWTWIKANSSYSAEINAHISAKKAAADGGKTEL